MKTLIILLFSIPCFATISVSNSVGMSVGSNVTTVNFAHTCAAGDNVSLDVGVVGMMSNSGGPFSITSVTWSTTNGPTINLTKNTTTFDFAGLVAGETWHMFNCPSGLAGTITANWTAGSCNCVSIRVIGVSRNNSDFTHPVISFIGTTTGNVNPATSTSFAVTVGAGDTLIAVANGGSTNTFTAFACSGGTPVEQFNATDNGNHNVGGYCDNLSAGSHTIGWTSNAADFRTMIVVQIKQFVSYPPVGSILTKTFAIPSITSTSITSIDALMGDTNLGGGWTLPALCSGSLNGGCEFVISNDATASDGTRCPVNYAICMFKMTAYSAGAPTFAAGPNMTGYGSSTVPGVSTCAGRTGWNNKNRGPFVFKGNLYTYIGCPNDTFTDWAQEGLVILPDGIHTCNYATWQAGSNTCTVSNWSSTGDAPVSDAGYQWANHSGSLTTVAAFQVIQTGVQGDPCFHTGLGPVGLPPDFVYLYSTQGIARFPCSAPASGVGSPMDPSIYTVRKGDGTWSSTLSDMASVNFGTYNLNSMTWNRFHDLFISTGDTGHGWATAPLPWGTWTSQNPITNTNFDFLGLFVSTLTVASGRVTGAIGMNNHSSPTSHNFQFEVIDLGPANPTWAISQ